MSTAAALCVPALFRHDPYRCDHSRVSTKRDSSGSDDEHHHHTEGRSTSSVEALLSPTPCPSPVTAALSVQTTMSAPAVAMQDKLAASASSSMAGSYVCAPGMPMWNSLVPCQCGCGALVAVYDSRFDAGAAMPERWGGAPGNAAVAAATLGAAVPSVPAAAPSTMVQHRLAGGVRFAPVRAVLAATERGESRKSGTRIGEQVCAWTRAGFDAATFRQPLATVFVAQLPFDLPLSALQDVADAVVPGPAVTVLQAVPHMRRGRSYDGCAFVRMPAGDAERFIAALHKRVLFDVDGVWGARGDAEQQRLLAYCHWIQERPAEERRQILKRPTPFSAVTAEFALRPIALPPSA